jgi:hypothetical protein
LPTSFAPDGAGSVALRSHGDGPASSQLTIIVGRCAAGTSRRGR